MNQNIGNNVSVETSFNPSDELKLLQTIISRYESNSFTLLNWLFTMLSGLTVALFTVGENFSAIGYLLISFSIILFFFVAILLLRVYKFRAIERATAIESIIRNGGNYDGPKISESLCKNCNYIDFKNTIKKRVIIVTVSIYVTVMLIALIYWRGFE